MLATSITKMSPREGFVMALYGSWGSGKTTVLNFVEHYLNEESEATKPIIIKFAPWWFSGQQDLTQRYFDQLAGHLKEDNRVSSATLDRLSEFADAISEFPIDIPVLTKVLRSGGKILRALKNARQKDLTKLRAQLEDALRKLARKIVVVVDDIDRLTADEIRQMFGVVKAVASFPNTIYLLAFDREVVVKALEPMQDLRKGKEYLEKIVQVGWDLPEPEDYMLPTMLWRFVNLAAEGTPDDLLDQNDLLNMFALVRGLLKTPRDCERIGNALLTTYPSVKGEVNFTDFMAMQVLSVCVPRLYNLFRTDPDSFAGIVQSSLDPNWKKDLKAFHDRWLENLTIIPSELREPVRDVAMRLFPKLQAVWTNYQYGSDFLATWQRECRAASPEILPTYFRFAILSTSFSRERTKLVLETSGDSAGLDRELNKLTREKLPDGRTALSVFLERATNLTPYVRLGGNQRLNLLTAVLNDDFIEIADRSMKIGFGLSIDNTWRIRWLVFALLKPLEPEERAGYLKSAVVNASGLSATVDLVAILDGEHDPQTRAKSMTEPLLTKQRCKELTEIGAGRIARAAQDGLLARAPLFGRVLWIWKQWKPQQAETWVKKFVENDEGLLKLIETSTGEVLHSSQDSVAQSFLTTDVKGLSEWIDLLSLRARLESLQSANLSEKQRFAIGKILKFLDAPNPTEPTGQRNT